MRTLISTHFVSLDGVAEAPGGEPGYRHSGWTFDVAQEPAMYEAKGREQEEATAMLMGGRTYDGSVRARLQALRERLSGPGAGA